LKNLLRKIQISSIWISCIWDIYNQNKVHNFSNFEKDIR
jgi:hypothetical protein